MAELLRIRQWIKNGLVLAPLFFGGALFQTMELLHALAAFGAFCLASSAVYIFNDWRDIEVDRFHDRNKTRPLPSGRISASAALGIMVGLVVGAIGMALAADLPHTFIWILGAYLAINLCYSLGLKQVTVLGLFLVTSGFVLRLLAGGFITPTVELSPWIIIATGTIALLLTAGKRRGDVAHENYAEERRQTNVEYNLQYLDAVLAALTGATLVVYLLFCVSDYATMRYGKLILVTAVPVAMGLLRYLQLVIVYKHGDTPTDLLLQDKGLMAIVLIFIFMFGVLIYIR